MMNLQFLILTFAVFLFLLVFFPRVMAVVLLLFHSLQEKPHERSTSNYKLGQLKESKTKMIRI